jgi:high affinity sulfate transporter 1
MAYAELAGLPAVTGLYTTVMALLAYAVFGPSRILILGPDSALAPLILAAILPLIGAGGDPAKAVALASAMAVIMAVICFVAGFAKLGVITELLSKPLRVGYLNGVAIVVVVSQLPKLFGYSVDGDGFFSELRGFFENLDQTVWQALAVGVGVLLVLLVLPRFTRTLPAVLVAVVGATVVSAVFSLSDKGVATVGALPQGIPRPSLPWTSLHDAGLLLLGAVGITLVSLTDAIATASSFAARRDEEVDPNQEMVAIGASNVATGLFQGFAISTSASRTAVAEQAGAKTQLAGVVGAGIVAVLLLFLNGLVADLPQSALAGVVIAAAIFLIDLRSLRRYWAVRRSAFLLSLTATLGVIVFGVLQGILIAIVLAVMLFFRRSWWPNGAVLGVVDDLDGWHSTEAHPGARELPGITVYRWEAPLFFANAGAFRRQVRELAMRPDCRWVVIQCEAITDIDVTAAAMLEDLDEELNARGIHMAFVEMRSRLQDMALRYGLMDTLDAGHFYPSMDTALAAIAAEGSGDGDGDGR